MRKAITISFFLICLCVISSFAIESGMFRLLSLSDSEKLILVSHIPSKTKYLLDASAAKITINEKSAEFKDLKAFSVIQVKFERKKIKRKGIDLDGNAMEIRVAGLEKIK